MSLGTKTVHTPQFNMAHERSSGGAQLVQYVTQESAEADEKARVREDSEEISSNGTTGQFYTEAEERKAVRVIDMWILPIMCITHMLLYWDKTLLGQSVLFGLSRDLDLTKVIGHDSHGKELTSSTRFSNVSWVFYVGYLVAAYPWAYMAQRLPTAKVCSAAIFLWSIVVMSTPACKNYSQLMVNRFFLGAMESCIAPTFTVYSGFWWTRHELGLRCSIWFGSLGIGMMLGPIASFGLGHIHGDLGSSWKYIFLVAGAVSMSWSLIVLWLLPDDPHRAKWLNPRNRAIILARLQAGGSAAVHRKFVAAQFWEAMMDFNTWSNAFFLGGAGIPNGAISSFSGLVIKGFGFDAFTSVLLITPMGVVSIMSNVIVGVITMRYKGSRYLCMVLSYCPALMGSCLDWLGPRHNRGLLYAGILLLPAMGGSAGMATAQQTSNVAGHTKKATTSAITFIGYCIGNIAGPLLFASTPGPRYAGGFISSFAIFAAMITLALFSRWYLNKENARRDRKYGTPNDELGLEDITDRQNKNFR